MSNLVRTALIMGLMALVLVHAQESKQDLKQPLIQPLIKPLKQPPAQEISGVTLSSSAVVGGKALNLRGGYLLRYKYFFKIYVAALYLPVDLAEQDVMGDIPRRIEFHYLRSLTAANLIEATNRTINTGRDAAAIALTAPQVAAFNALYPDVKLGDVMMIDYHPGRGTTMLINNVERGTIVGREFANALFGIWIGDNCFDTDLKKALLGTP
jgi:Chalcone isomerase-like